MTYIFPDLSIDVNDDHFHEHIELGYNGQMIKMALMAVMEWYNMATNMFIIGVNGKIRNTVDHL